MELDEPGVEQVEAAAAEALAAEAEARKREVRREPSREAKRDASREASREKMEAIVVDVDGETSPPASPKKSTGSSSSNSGGKKEEGGPLPSRYRARDDAESKDKGVRPTIATSSDAARAGNDGRCALSVLRVRGPEKFRILKFESRPERVFLTHSFAFLSPCRLQFLEQRASRTVEGGAEAAPTAAPAPPHNPYPLTQGEFLLTPAENHRRGFFGKKKRGRSFILFSDGLWWSDDPRNKLHVPNDILTIFSHFQIQITRRLRPSTQLALRTRLRRP